MALGRRAFLASLAATGLARAGWAAAGSPSFLAAAKLPAGDYAILGLGARGDEIFRVGPSHAAFGGGLRAQARRFRAGD